jgi:starch phosphorylase
VTARRRAGHDPSAAIALNADLAHALDAIASGTFSPNDHGRYRDLTDDLVDKDHFMTTADFGTYAAAQRRVDAIWSMPADWWSRAIRNTARMAWFSGDRAIREYAGKIWDVPVP